MTYDFDQPVERRGTNCVKWDETTDPDVIPMWVADMDFPVAPAIQRAVARRASHPVYGYAVVPEAYFQSVQSWFLRRHHWTIERHDMLYTTGVVPALSCALQALTMPGMKVLILTPVYNCFFSSIRNSGCEVLSSELVLQSSGFEINWTDFQQKCADPKTTAFVLCNPHNPVGRLWTSQELSRMNDICLRHGVKVISDEIHCELIMPGHTFTPFAAVSDACRDNAVVLNSPSKSFNTAGLQIANIVCHNTEWRRLIDRAININEVCDVNPFAPLAAMAAYNESEDWIDQLCLYLWNNYTVLCDFLAQHLPLSHVTPLQATYLAWVDIRPLGITSEALCQRLLVEGKVRVNPGTMYGTDGFIRINIACPRCQLIEALQRISSVLKQPASGGFAARIP